VGKLYTAAALHRLAERGSISLELPDIRRWDMRQPLTPPRILAAISGGKATAPPGIAYSYSNLGYHLAALAAERSTGQSLGALVNAEVTAPLGRFGGLRADLADISGVFVFRLEDPAALDPANLEGARRMEDGSIPVIYRLNLRQPTSFFAAQGFAVRDDDLLYVSTAPGADLQRFLTTLSSVAFSTIAIGDTVR
jgi:Beta-lactamase